MVRPLWCRLSVPATTLTWMEMGAGFGVSQMHRGIPHLHSTVVAVVSFPKVGAYEELLSSSSVSFDMPSEMMPSEGFLVSAFTVLQNYKKKTKHKFIKY